MRYRLQQDDARRAESEFIKDLCLIVSSYTNEEVLDLENEYFEKGFLKRGALTILPINEDG